MFKLQTYVTGMEEGCECGYQKPKEVDWESCAYPPIVAFSKAGLYLFRDLTPPVSSKPARVRSATE